MDHLPLDRLLPPLLEACPGLEAVYLFGSLARGEGGGDSDLDLALLNPTPLDPAALWLLAQRLAAVAGRPVDLVDLAAASTVLRAQVIAAGRLLYCADPARCERFADYCYSSYARLNEERAGILADIAARGSVYGG